MATLLESLRDGRIDLEAEIKRATPAGDISTWSEEAAAEVARLQAELTQVDECVGSGPNARVGQVDACAADLG